MSNVTCDNGVTSSQSPTGVEVIQVSDFYQRAGILHPITVGTIAIIVLFVYLRLSSNRVVAPMTLFDWLLNVALGSTLAGIVNGTSLTRGLLSLTTLMAFQLLASQLSSHYGLTLERALNSPPLVIAFRGKALRDVMRKHRISQTDLNSALRRENIWNIRQVEAVIIEPTGMFSIYKRDTKPDGLEPEVLMDVPGYRKLVEHFDQEQGRDEGGQGGGKKGGNGEGESGFSRDSRGTRTMQGEEESEGDEEHAVRGVRIVQTGRQRGDTNGKPVGEAQWARKHEGSRRRHNSKDEKLDDGQKDKGGEEKQGGQGDDGPTTGSERAANDIAQSEA